MAIFELITDFWDALLFFSIPLLLVLGWLMVD